MTNTTSFRWLSQSVAPRREVFIDQLALAGDWYRWFTSQHLDNRGSPERWSTLREVL